MITRQIFPEVLPRVEYQATDLARSVAPILRSLRDWGNQFRAEQQRLSELVSSCPAEQPNVGSIPEAAE